MTLQEKTGHLKDMAMLEAREQGNAIIEQHREALEKVYEQYKAEVMRQSATQIKAETTRVRHQLHMAASKSQVELKRELGRMQRELEKDLFLEVEEKMQEYMKTEDYKQLLVSYIEKAAGFAGGMAMTIYINPTDEDKKAYLEEHTGMQLTVSREDFIGGVRAVVHERNILVDYAFKGGLERERRNFTFEGGTGIG